MRQSASLARRERTVYAGLDPRHAHIRIASWPHWYRTTPYLDLLYGALESYGIEHIRHLPLDWTAFGKGAAKVNVSHLHWPEFSWRRPGRTLPRQLIRLAKLKRYIGAVKRSGARILWTVHNLEDHDGARLIDRTGYRLLHRSVDLRIFTSEWARAEALVRYGEGNGETLVMPHGNFDGAFPAARPRSETLEATGIASSRKILLCFGHMRDYKGFDIAIDALKYLPADEYHLIVVGRPYYPYASAIEAAAGTRRDVSVFLEEVDQQRLANLIGASDAVLLPYRSVTGSGVLLTALTFSRGVIASDLPYFREVLDSHAESRVFARSGGPRAFADAITEFFVLPRTRRDQAARALASSMAWPRIVEPLADWLRANAAPDGDES